MRTVFGAITFVLAAVMLCLVGMPHMKHAFCSQQELSMRTAECAQLNREMYAMEREITEILKDAGLSPTDSNNINYCVNTAWAIKEFNIQKVTAKGFNSTGELISIVTISNPRDAEAFTDTVEALEFKCRTSNYKKAFKTLNKSNLDISSIEVLNKNDFKFTVEVYHRGVVNEE